MTKSGGSNLHFSFNPNYYLKAQYRSLSAIRHAACFTWLWAPRVTDPFSGRFFGKKKCSTRTSFSCFRVIHSIFIKKWRWNIAFNLHVPHPVSVISYSIRWDETSRQFYELYNSCTAAQLYVLLCNRFRSATLLLSKHFQLQVCGFEAWSDSGSPKITKNA